MLPKFNKNRREKEKKVEFQQHCYRNSFAQIPARPMSCVLKKSNCGNAIAEIGKKRKKILVIVAMVLSKMEKKLNGIMAMSLLKMGGKKKILLPKSGKKFLKKCYVHNIFIILSQKITGD